MSKYHKIAILPGDGIGPEVTAEAVKVLKSLDINFDLLMGDIGSQAYNATGSPIPDETKEICENAEAVLMGAIGHSYAPYGIPELVVKYLRVEKGAYVNICPLILFPGIFPREDKRSAHNIDIIVIRSNMDGFVLEHEGDLWRDKGRDVRIITRDGAERVARFACEYTEKKGRMRITCIDAHNLLYGDKLFREAFSDVAEGFPDIQKEYLSVNVASMVLSTSPWHFDVIISHDIFGDMLTWNIIGQIGGIGMASQASIGDDFAVFQPVGGAAWKIAGKGIANPIGSILAAKLMLDWLGEEKEADLIGSTIEEVIMEGETLTPDLGGRSTTKEVGDAVRAHLSTRI